MNKLFTKYGGTGETHLSLALLDWTQAGLSFERKARGVKETKRSIWTDAETISFPQEYSSVVSAKAILNALVGRVAHVRPVGREVFHVNQRQDIRRCVLFKYDTADL